MDNELVFSRCPPRPFVRRLLTQKIYEPSIPGTGQAVELRYVDTTDADDSSTAPAPAPPLRSTPQEHSTVGVVPGLSAMTAAPAALPQLSATVDAIGQGADTLAPSTPLHAFETLRQLRNRVKPESVNLHVQSARWPGGYRSHLPGPGSADGGKGHRLGSLADSI